MSISFPKSRNEITSGSNYASKNTYFGGPVHGLYGFGGLPAGYLGVEHPLGQKTRSSWMLAFARVRADLAKIGGVPVHGVMTKGPKAAAAGRPGVDEAGAFCARHKACLQRQQHRRAEQAAFPLPEPWPEVFAACFTTFGPSGVLAKVACTSSGCRSCFFFDLTSGVGPVFGSEGGVSGTSSSSSRAAWRICRVVFPAAPLPPLGFREASTLPVFTLAGAVLVTFAGSGALAGAVGAGGAVGS